MAETSPITVTLLTQAECGFCEDAKQLIRRLANEYPLQLRTIDIDSPEGRHCAEKGGILFPPGILVEGEPFSYGRPSERKLRQTLARWHRKT